MDSLGFSCFLLKNRNMEVMQIILGFDFFDKDLGLNLKKINC